MSPSKCRIYVGNLPPDIRTKDIEDLFYRFGKIAFVDLKTRRGPPFAFVEFVDPRDAKDAVYERDGYDYDGYKLRVEFPRGRERGPGGVFKSGSRGGGSSSTNHHPKRPAPTRRSTYRIKVTGLPSSGSWQDLKDHMREAGDVCYADVFKDGTGVVEFLHHNDMKYALNKLDGSKFRSHEGETSYIRIEKDSSDRGDRRSHGHGHHRSRTRSRSRSYSRSRSRSRSRSYRSSSSRDSSISSKHSRDSPTYSPPPRSRSHRRSRSRSRSSRSRTPSSSASESSRHHSRSRSPTIYSRSRSHTPDNRNRSLSRSRSPPTPSPSPHDKSLSHSDGDESSRSIHD